MCLIRPPARSKAYTVTIPQTTISLVQLRAGQIVGSTYHTVRQTGDLRKAGETEERITAVASWHDAPYFTGAERVALELVEAGLTPNPFAERVPDELHARASAHYDDKALWTLTLAIGQICFFIPSRSSPSRSLAGSRITASDARNRSALSRFCDQALSRQPAPLPPCCAPCPLLSSS